MEKKREKEKQKVAFSFSGLRISQVLVTNRQNG